MKNIMLIGPMDSGKATIARQFIADSHKMKMVGHHRLGKVPECDLEISKFAGNSRFLALLSMQVEDYDRLYFCVNQAQFASENTAQVIEQLKQAKSCPPITLVLTFADQYNYVDSEAGNQQFAEQIGADSTLIVSKDDADSIAALKDHMVATKKIAPTPEQRQAEFDLKFHPDVIKVGEIKHDPDYLAVWKQNEDKDLLGKVEAIFWDYCRTSYTRLCLAGHPKRRHHHEVREILQQKEYANVDELLEKIKGTGYSTNGSMMKRVLFVRYQVAVAPKDDIEKQHVVDNIF